MILTYLRTYAICSHLTFDYSSFKGVDLMAKLSFGELVNFRRKDRPLT